MTLSPLSALSPLDGRYAARCVELREVFSEAGLIRARVRVEVAWLQALAAQPAITELNGLSREEAEAMVADAMRDCADEHDEKGKDHEAKRGGPGDGKPPKPGGHGGPGSH